MKTARNVLGIVLVAAVVDISCADPAETATPRARPSIPYVATRSDTVQDMLWIANAGKDDILYDLGSGDGRIVIAAVSDSNVRRAVGIEIDPNRVAESRKNARKARVTKRIEFIEGDLFATDFSRASIVTLFLGRRQNIKLRPKMLRILKPGTRIVSHQFGMGEWEADKAFTVRTKYLGMYGEAWNPFALNKKVPDYNGNESHFGTSNKIMMWVVPPPIAGIWRGKVKTEQGLQNLKLTLHQRLSEVTGRFKLSGKTDMEGWVSAELWGNHTRLWCKPDKVPYGRFELRFDGHVHENTMKGTLAVVDRGKIQECEWKARRDTVDFTGMWEWPCASDPRLVQLLIERRDGRLFATYFDQGQETPVTDFYDWRGGFYFTLMIGREDNGSIRITEDTGWLIGEAILDDDVLKGRIEFYPLSENMSGEPDEGKASRPVIKDWTPRLVKP
ncbi:MAG: class I SAM-dependent methyltransferase [Sedimentisphaerales bacterium]|nr:class I SAM-dependent methyltransferase [Sedimentisphaerales bacterium]